MRSAGILLPIFSLPNKYGIGTFGKEAYDYVDFLKKCHQKYWQVLPLNPTSYGDSPYQSFSCFAGNPYFIDFDILKEEGLLFEDEYSYLIDTSCSINYGKLYETRFNVLRIAYSRFNKTLLDTFITNNAYWINDYALFMSLKYYFGGLSFHSWPNEFKFRDEKSISLYINSNKEDIYFWIFLQYEFFKQWSALKKYANDNNIYIIGDMPIYTALDSSDVWARPNQFLLDKTLTPSFVAGCPKDDFSPLGQLWGNPLYNYKFMKKDSYSWWVERMKQACLLYDCVRIDHFRGFEAYFCIPYGDKDALSGHWEKGPNINLFKEIEKQIGKVNIIAENLGFLTDDVQIMLDKLGYPGMKVLEFGFDPNGNSDGAIHNLTSNIVVYPGTHDNYPIRAWYDSLDLETKTYVKDYLYFDNDWDVGNRLIKAALSSVANTCIISFQDYLQKGAEARINTPSTLGNNWMWRMEKGDMNDDLASFIAYLTDLYRR